MAQLIRDSSSSPVQMFVQSGARVNVSTAGATSSAATALPASVDPNGSLVEIRATGACFINFGTGGVAASADSTSMLFPAGEKSMKLPKGTTHFAIIRVGSDDVVVQIENLG